jgi:hypothetical protein
MQFEGQESEARTRLVDLFSILLKEAHRCLNV